MSSDTPRSGRERVLFLLKTKGPQTAARMAKRLHVTTMAVRQHLAALQGDELVHFTDERGKVGRPARLWRLTPKAHERFPDCHAELAVGMLQAIHRSFGEHGLERLTEERTRQQTESYRAQMPGSDAPLEERVAALARIRREEGYMAEGGRRRDGTFALVENHCSIAKAARVCPKLCDAELSLFRAVLGDDVSVARVEHILSGDRCCSYCITERPANGYWQLPVGSRPAVRRTGGGPRGSRIRNGGTGGHSVAGEGMSRLSPAPRPSIVTTGTSPYSQAGAREL